MVKNAHKPLIRRGNNFTCCCWAIIFVLENFSYVDGLDAPLHLLPPRLRSLVTSRQLFRNRLQNDWARSRGAEICAGGGEFQREGCRAVIILTE